MEANLVIGKIIGGRWMSNREPKRRRLHCRGEQQLFEKNILEKLNDF